MDKEEYVFMNKKYEAAVTEIKAQLFDVISNEEKKAMRIGLEMSREGIAEDKFNKLQELAVKQGEDLGRVITLTSKLYDALARLDSYTKILRDLRKEKASTEEMEKNVQATAAEVITSINETGVSQETKDKMIENVGVITDTAQVTMPESVPENVTTLSTDEATVPQAEVAAPVVQPEPVIPVPLEENKTEEVAAPQTEVATPIAQPEPVIPVPLEENKTEEASAPQTEVVAPVVQPEPVIPVPLEENKTVEASESQTEVAAPAVNPEPLIPVPLEENKTVEASEPQTEVAAPTVNPEPLIPVPLEENKTEEVAASQTEVAAPAVNPEPLIPVPVEENKTVEASEPQTEVAAPAVNPEPLIPVTVEENKTEEAAASQAEVATPGVQPVLEVAPLPDIPLPSEDNKTDEIAVGQVETANSSTNATVAPSTDVTDTAPLIPLQNENIAQDASNAEKKIENVDSLTNNFLETAPLIPSVDSNTSNAVETTTPSVETTTPSVENATPSVETETKSNTSDEMKFIKNDQFAARALLTSKKQITNLRSSLATQEALYSTRQQFNQGDALENQLVQNGLLPADTDTLKKKVEQLMEQANALYKEGKANEAQVMYDQISELNKQIQEKSNSISV